MLGGMRTGTRDSHLVRIAWTKDARALQARLIFGVRETFTVAEGRVPTPLQFRSPAHRPVQVTRGLVSSGARDEAATQSIH